MNLSLDSRPPSPTTGFGREARPEEVELIEFGIKAAFDQGYVNVALFDQTISDFQSNLFVGGGFNLANAEEQSVRGFEIESLYSPTEDLDLTFAITYLDPNYDVFTQAPCESFDTVNCANDEESRDLSGTDPAGFHEISLAASAVYHFDVSETISGFLRGEYSL